MIREFVVIMGISFNIIPYMSQSTAPMQKTKNVTNEMSCVDLVFHNLTTCGKNEIVVNNAAAVPTMVKYSICILSICALLIFPYLKTTDNNTQ
jgi:fibrillarin-like rRNA methylase